MSINSYFFNAIETGGKFDRVYSAQDFTNYLDKLVGDGVFPTPTTNLMVRAQSGLGIFVTAGQGWIKGHKMELTADMSLMLDTADPVINRVDRVVFYVDWNRREMGISILKGLTDGPVELTRNGKKWEMCLAEITVPKQATQITNANIRDTRGNSELCGFVQGLIQQIDTTDLFIQFRDALNEQLEQQRQEFMEWFDEMKGQLSSDAAGNLQNQINDINAELTASFGEINDVLETGAFLKVRGN